MGELLFISLFMRCRNCGWNNRSEQVTCEKCGAPLEYGSNAYSESVGARYDGSVNINATIPERRAFGNEEDYEEAVCPKCGYPLGMNATKCPNCNYDVSMFKNNYGQQNFSNERATRVSNPIKEEQMLSKTINPYMVESNPEHTFVLMPQQRVNEKKELQNLEYEGNRVVLTRSNTEPDNGSITSSQQAELTYENGCWHIEDKSEQHTTFVQASSKIALKDGDIILLGNRLFKFSIPEN